MSDAAVKPRDATATANSTKAALYLRVSTGRQAESDLSIPDQRRQIIAYCEAKGWDVRANMWSRVPPPPMTGARRSSR